MNLKSMTKKRSKWIPIVLYSILAIVGFAWGFAMYIGLVFTAMDPHSGKLDLSDYIIGFPAVIAHGLNFNLILSSETELILSGSIGAFSFCFIYFLATKLVCKIKSHT